MNINHCPACGSDRLGLLCTPESAEFKGVEILVPKVLSTACESCGYTFSTNEQHDLNVAATRAAFVEQGAAAKAKKGLLTGSQLRAIREQLGLSQREASELFGGGPVAFSKYENEDVAQSVAMDRLIRMVEKMGRFGLETLKTVVGRTAAAPNDAVEQAPSGTSVFIITYDTRAVRKNLKGKPGMQARGQGTTPVDGSREFPPVSHSSLH